MAQRKTAVNEIDMACASIDRFAPLIGEGMWSELARSMDELKAALHGRALWNVNSTGRGGGVAEMLASLVPYERGCGIDERWAVIEGSPEFFAATKKIHTLLHGIESGAGLLTDEDREAYRQATKRNARALTEMIGPGDAAILHDPQTAGLIPELRARGIPVIWRSHIGVDEPNRAVRDAWSFLLPFVSEASAYVFSRRAYVWEGLEPARVRIIAPCIDPFATKNQDLTDHAATAILHAAGILRGSDAEATFQRHDGTRARVTRSVELGAATLPIDARIVLQVSRWDRLKDPVGVMEAFVRHVAPRTDAWLVLAGPAATSVSDDPEQPEILDDLSRRREGMPEDVRRRVLIAQLPMGDTEENAAIVNALQGRADVVVQKSLAEGFGLTVAEAMFKRRPVVASRVGGIEDQIEHGESGLLIDDARDLQGFGEAVVRVLDDAPLANSLGTEARRRVMRRFITPCHLIAQAALVREVLCQT